MANKIVQGTDEKVIEFVNNAIKSGNPELMKGIAEIISKGEFFKEMTEKSVKTSDIPDEIIEKNKQRDFGKKFLKGN
jgi:hypothetical protein